MLYDMLKKDSAFMPDCTSRVYDISNVADFVSRAKNWPEWGEKGLSKIIHAFPPHPVFFMEAGGFREKVGFLWSVEKVESDGWRCKVATFTGFRDGSMNTPVKAGSKLHMAICFENGGRRKDSDLWDTRDDELKEKEQKEKALIYPYTLIAYDPRGKGLPAEPDYVISFSLTEDGALVSTDESQFRINYGESQLRNEEDYDASAPPGTTLRNREEHQQYLRNRAMCWGLLDNFRALMFLNLHSKCLSIDEIAPGRQFRKRHEQAGEYLPVTFKVLVVTGENRKPSLKTNSQDIDVVRHHIRRGHFRINPKDHPIKQFRRDFWIEESEIGDRENGRVEVVRELKLQ